MKEFILTMPYNSIDEMVNSGEMAVYIDELKQGNIDKYAIVSRIGNRYDINGNRRDGWIDNPFVLKQDEEINTEEVSVKYFEIEQLIDEEVAKAVSELQVKHQQEIATLKSAHEREIAEIGIKIKADLIAKLNA